MGYCESFASLVVGGIYADSYLVSFTNYRSRDVLFSMDCTDSRLQMARNNTNIYRRA